HNSPDGRNGDAPSSHVVKPILPEFLFSGAVQRSVEAARTFEASQRNTLGEIHRMRQLIASGKVAQHRYTSNVTVDDRQTMVEA
ncbi:unnamed protein product, partial [Chrysoparadoxa australica]